MSGNALGVEGGRSLREALAENTYALCSLLCLCAPTHVFTVRCCHDITYSKTAGLSGLTIRSSQSIHCSAVALCMMRAKCLEMISCWLQGFGALGYSIIWGC